MIVRIIDASVAAAWVLPDEGGEDVERLVRTEGDDRLGVPFHYPAETGNVLLMALRRRRLTSAEAVFARELLDSLALTIDCDGQDRIWGHAWSLAEKHGLTIYDALYLELAIRLDRPLATFDSDLRKAAKGEGVALA